MDAQIEDRRRKHKRKKRPCSRQDASTGRWFWGHDVTLFLGDVTIVTGNNPCYSSDEIVPDKPLLDEHSPGILGGQKPGLLGHHKPGLLGGHKPGLLGGHKPGLLDNHKPLFPLFGNRPNHHKPSQVENKPVYEIIDEDQEEEQYRPGTVVGAPISQIDGHGQDLTNFSPTRIFSQISRHFNRIVDPFIDLFV